MTRPSRTLTGSIRQGGFSMVEMLMAAFILAIGVLGLTMLMTMAVRTATSGRALNAGVQVAERILDEAEAQGRNSLLYSKTKNTPVFPVSTNYFAGPVNATYDITGSSTGNPYFISTTAREIVVAPVPGVGGFANIQVTVRWSEGQGANGAPLDRQVVLSRRVAYALESI